MSGIEIDDGKGEEVGNKEGLGETDASMDGEGESEGEGDTEELEEADTDGELVGIEEVEAEGFVLESNSRGEVNLIVKVGQLTLLGFVDTTQEPFSDTNSIGFSVALGEKTLAVCKIQTVRGIATSRTIRVTMLKFFLFSKS